MGLTLTAILLGIVEGLTEFIPVSSTGHLILATELFGYDAAQWAMFNVIIQLGAILGLAFKDQIDIMLGSPELVAWALILGGIAILGIEKIAVPKGEESVAELPLRQVLGVGFAQCLAMIPGVSRSGATIMGALAMGVNRKTAAEFSFFLAVPTMLGATTLELFQKGDQLTAGQMAVGWTEIAIGFVVSFVVALVVIRAFVAYVSRHGFAPFAWYRIVAGVAAIAWLSLR